MPINAYPRARPCISLPIHWTGIFGKKAFALLLCAYGQFSAKPAVIKSCHPKCGPYDRCNEDHNDAFLCSLKYANRVFKSSMFKISLK